MALVGVLYFKPVQVRLSDVVIEPVETRAAVMPLLVDFLGRAFWQVSLREISTKIEGDHRFKSAVVQREFPNRLKIQVESRTPALALLNSKGQLFPVSADGTLLPNTDKDQNHSFPLLRGPDFEQRSDLRAKAVELVHSVQAINGFSSDQISEIYYSEKKGFTLYLLGLNSEIYLGDADFGLKMKRVQRVVSYLNSQNIKGRVIDARFTKKVVVRVRKSP